MILCDEKNWKVWTDSEGVLFTFPEHCPLDRRAHSARDSIANERAALLRLIAEQCESLEIRDGIRLEWAAVCQLPVEARESLSLPECWLGGFRAQYKGLAKNPDFKITLKLLKPDGEQVEGVEFIDGIFKIGMQVYLSNWRQYKLLGVIKDFEKCREDGLTYYESISAIERLQTLSRDGIDIDLNAFDELEIVRPNAVRVALEEQNDGSILISPDLCSKQIGPEGGKSVIDPKELDTRIEGHLPTGRRSGCIPVGNKILLLDEKVVSGIREITRNNHIAADQVVEFIKQPTAWLNAEFVDLDLGFSERVQGAAPLRLAYFGETDESGIQWIETKEPESVDEDGSDSHDDSLKAEELGEDEEFEEPAEPNVLDIELDDDGESPSDQLNVQIPDESLRSQTLVEIAGLKRKPYPHQQEAIRWLLALSCDQDRDPLWTGALLADDMGLGKTLTVLAFMREYLHRTGAKEPALVVAPVSLLEVWRLEIEKTFEASPFSEVVVLHSSADLGRFRIKGAGREIIPTEPEANAGEIIEASDLNTGIRYALKVASNDDNAPGIDKLGRANSLIITNYETVRDYQFSLARIPWSITVFDEAQAIKNPNAMVTRAIKALNASFSVIMTGTPVENSLKDFWCLMDRVQRGLLNNYQPFRREYISPIVAARRDGTPEYIASVRNDVGMRLRNRVSGFMLRRMKEDHLEGLPAKEVILHKQFGTPSSGYDERIICTMPEGQQLIYDQVANLEREEGDDDPSQRGRAILAAIHNLKATSLHPALVLSSKIDLPQSRKEAWKSISESGKLIKLIEILEDIKSQEEKALIFVINKSLQMFLQYALKEYFKLEGLPAVINGDTKVKKSRNGTNTSRTEIIDNFQRSPGFGILILSPIAAGVGLTITGANHVIHLERHWNPAKEAQATDRVYRIGQEKPVSVWVPILKHPSYESFDEKLDRLLAMKSGLSKSVVAPEIVDPRDLGSLVTSDISKDETQFALKDLPTLKWDLFEAMIAILLDRDGAQKVILTQSQGDKGCDVVAIGWRNENWLIQCKHRQNIKGKVGGGSVRQIAGARKYYESKLGMQFTKIAVFSNVKKFDSAAIEAARIENAALFKLKDIQCIYPPKGIRLRELLTRKEITEAV